MDTPKYPATSHVRAPRCSAHVMAVWRSVCGVASEMLDASTAAFHAVLCLRIAHPGIQRPTLSPYAPIGAGAREAGQGLVFIGLALSGSAPIAQAPLCLKHFAATLNRFGFR